MEALAFRVEKERRYGQHITIGNYSDGKRVYGQRSIYAWSLAADYFISGKTKRLDGKVIIKKEFITPDDLVILFHTGEYWAVHFYKVEDLIVYATAWPISKERAEALQFKKEGAIA